LVQTQGATLTHLVPLQELSPGAVGAIRNQVIKSTVAQAVRELNLPEDKLVVRDVRPLLDLAMDSAVGTASTSERWGFGDALVAIGWISVTGANTMGDQRYVALYGVRDMGLNYGASGSATIPVALASYKEIISFIRINVGGADKVVWDISGIRAYQDANVAFAPSAVVIPQNASFNISYYREGSLEAGVPVAPTTLEVAWLQLVGIVVEPRGKVISP